jgi:phosphohistidine phosphatase SixA
MIKDAQLVLLRHGVASDKAEHRTPAEDFARSLSKKGVRQSVNAGRLLRRVGPRFDACYCSPAVRCVQTAVLACQELKGVKPKPKRELLSMSNRDGVGLVQDGGAVLLVLHGPDLDSLVDYLTRRTVDTSRGTIAAVKITNGQGELTQLLTPKQIASMVRPSRAGGRRADRSAALSLTLAREERLPSLRRVQNERRASGRPARIGQVGIAGAAHLSEAPQACELVSRYWPGLSCP